MNETTDLDIFFALGAHNDSLPFDGTSELWTWILSGNKDLGAPFSDGIVAHGFYPTDGNLHFDAAEKWTLNMPEGINLYQVPLHRGPLSQSP